MYLILEIGETFISNERNDNMIIELEEIRQELKAYDVKLDELKESL